MTYKTRALGHLMALEKKTGEQLRSASLRHSAEVAEYSRGAMNAEAVKFFAGRVAALQWSMREIAELVKIEKSFIEAEVKLRVKVGT